MHACEMADALGIPTVIIPQYAGVLSALGMLLADVRKDYSQTILKLSNLVTFDDLEQHLAPLIVAAKADLASEGFASQDLIITCSLDMRYQGQGYEINVPLTSGFTAEFNREHQRLYGYSNSARPIEIVNVRVNAAGITRKYSFPSSSCDPQPLPVASATRPAWFGGNWRDTPLYHSEQLNSGMEGAGPAIITSGQSTIVIPPSFGFRINGKGNLIATRVKLGEQHQLAEISAERAP
jgi:N-methylhydantoinase A/oxoprolinase/acetone carboxylase beta subunit